MDLSLPVASNTVQLRREEVDRPLESEDNFEDTEDFEVFDQRAMGQAPLPLEAPTVAAAADLR